MIKTTTFNEKVLLIAALYLTVMFLSRKLNRQQTIVRRGITDPSFRQNIDDLAFNIKNLENSTENSNSSKHYFENTLSENMRTNINNIDQYIRKDILKDASYKYISDITELYVATKKKEGENSDKSFENVHTDSPFHYCETYRFLICIEGSQNIETHIVDDNINIVLKKYDILGFDYANTLHYIENRNENTKDGNRILLKLQYAKSNTCYNLTNKYTKFSRKLFENNKQIMGLHGKLMIISQFVSAYIFYFLLVFYLTLFLHFKYLKRLSGKKYKFAKRLLLIPFFTFIVLTAIMSVGLQLYFFMM